VQDRLQVKAAGRLKRRRDRMEAAEEATEEGADEVTSGQEEKAVKKMAKLKMKAT
jgi:hypothetical protein